MTTREREKRNREMAWLYRTGQLTQVQLARRYDMSQPNVQNILRKFEGVVLTGPDLPEDLPNQYGRDLSRRNGNGAEVWPCRIERSAHPVCFHGRDCHNAARCGAAAMTGDYRTPHQSGVE